MSSNGGRACSYNERRPSMSAQGSVCFDKLRRPPHWSSAVPLSRASTAEPSPRQSSSTNSPPPGFGEMAPLLATPGTFINDCPPSPGLTKRLLAIAQTRKRSGRHSLVRSEGASSKRVLRLSLPVVLSPESCIDRWGIPDDVFSSLIAGANSAKKAGQHKLVRRRLGLAGDVEAVLLLASGEGSGLCRHISTTSTASVYSPDPSSF